MLLIVDLIFPFAVGGLLGVLYFYGLWLSLGRLSRSRHPIAWLLGSAAVRIAGLVAVFYLVMDGAWERLAACLLGFVVARLVLIRRLRPKATAEALELRP